MKFSTRGGFTKWLFHIDRFSIFIHCLLLATFLEAGAKRVGKPQNKPHDLKLSTPEECARTCHAGEPTKICYYHFTLEMYPSMGLACNVCTPNNTNEVTNSCQCIQNDGVERTVLTANRMMPGPSIQVCKGDKVVVDVTNMMEGMATAIHWHGILQEGSQYYDGVPLLTQCPIQQGDTFRYQWTAADVGTHFWHSHSGLQKMDGLFGSIVIRQPVAKDPNSHLYDYDLIDHVILISDWMHEQTIEHFPGLLNTPGQRPDSLLINGKGRYTYDNGTRTKTPYKIFTVKAGYRYRFRMVNAFCSVCPAAWRIRGHSLQVIATDGEAVKPEMVNNIISFPGERYDFVLHANQTPGDYWIHLRGLGECAGGAMQQLGILRYEGTHKKLLAAPPSFNTSLFEGRLLNPLDGFCSEPREDAVCINQLRSAEPIDVKTLTDAPDVKIFLPFRFLTMDPKDLFKLNTYDHFLVSPRGQAIASLIDEISFEFPPSPPISQISDIPKEQFCNEKNRPKNCTAPCTCTHVVPIPLGSVVEVILVDEIGAANLSHPFHLHGYNFYVIGTGRSPDKNITKINVKHVIDLDKRGLINRMMDKPPRKDTIPVPDNGYVVFRFIANNPGYWLFHCHFLYHITVGMDMVLHVGEHKDLPPVPEGFPTCGDYIPKITPPAGYCTPYRKRDRNNSKRSSGRNYHI